jgi:hypothetical protein
MESVFDADVLGKDSLPPAPAYAAESSVAPAPGAALGGVLDRPQGGIFAANAGPMMAALGAGLSSAGQNWNKPAMAAFASGAGTALQGGQQWSNQQQDTRLKALHAAIAAWKAGDIAAYGRALAMFRAAGAPLATPTGPAHLMPPVPDMITEARDAIARGAPRDAVISRLREHGIDPSGL